MKFIVIAVGLSIAALGSIDTVYLVAYAVGQFANGWLGDRIGPRRLIALGMFASAVTSLCFGLSSAYLPMLIAFAVNGLFQTSGWPGNVCAMRRSTVPPWLMTCSKRARDVAG